MSTTETFIRPSDVAVAMGCSASVIIRLILNGTLPARKTPSGRYLIDPADAEKLLRPAVAAAPVLQLLPRSCGVRA